MINAGKRVLDWLYKDQLMVDEEWSQKRDNGFTWWADKHAQTIEITNEVTNPDGTKSQLISVRTDLLKDLEITQENLIFIGSSLMDSVSLAGPVYDSTNKKLMLCSMVRVHDGNSDLLEPLLSMASVLQIGESKRLAQELANLTGATNDTSGHPINGLRPQADDLARIIQTSVIPGGKEPSRWSEKEFVEVEKKYMQKPPSVGATSGANGCTVEFPFGDQSSLCRFIGNQPHPFYGNGLLVLQSFYLSKISQQEGLKIALSLNEIELLNNPSGYGFGSYSYTEGLLHYVSFFTNFGYRYGLLPNLYFNCAERARFISLKLLNQDWDTKTFSPNLHQSAFSRFFNRIRGKQ